VNVSLSAEFDPTPSIHLMYYVYILKNLKFNKLYYGYTRELNKRLAEHNRRNQFELIYYEAYKSEVDARNRERKLKHYAQALTALKGRLKNSLN